MEGNNKDGADCLTSIDLNSLLKVFLDSLSGPVDVNNPAAADIAAFMATNNLMSGNWQPVSHTLGPVKAFLSSSGQFTSAEQRCQIISKMIKKALHCLGTDTQVNLYVGTHAKDNSDPLNASLGFCSKYLTQVLDAYMEHDPANAAAFAEVIHSLFRNFCKEWHAALSEAFSDSSKAFEFVKIIAVIAADQMTEVFSANPVKAQMFSSLVVRLFINLVNESDAASAGLQ